eukprot:4652297-Prymnesium_polylepis.2
MVSPGEGRCLRGFRPVVRGAWPVASFVSACWVRHRFRPGCVVGVPSIRAPPHCPGGRRGGPRDTSVCVFFWMKDLDE